MSTIAHIHGGSTLSGEINLIPNKNSFMPAIPASILSNKPVTYHNYPQTSDVRKLLEVLQLLGAQVEKTEDTITINCSTITKHDLVAAGATIRSTLLFAGPLLARFGRAVIPYAWGLHPRVPRYWRPCGTI